MTIAIDTETYYAKDTEKNRKAGIEPCSVDKLGPVAYTRHPLFDCYLVAVVGEGIHYVGHPNDFDWRKLHGKHVIAHNMGFDGMVAQPYLDAHGVVPAAMDCTADLAVYFGHPRSLSGAMKSLFGTFVSKQIRTNMDGVRWEDLDAYKQRELIQYADADSVNCLRIWDALAPKWPEFERQISRTNREMGWRGLPVDWNKASRNMAALAYRLEQLENEIPWCGAFDEDGEEIKLGSRKAFNDACVALGIPPPTTKNKKAESWIAWLEEYSERATFAKAMAEHASVNKMLKTYETLFKRRIGGRVSYESLYFGAHTGRNSGSGGLNMMNLNKDAVAGTKIRETFSAAPGRILLNADLSQIEPRVLAFLCGDTNFLELCQTGASPYVVHGVLTNRVPRDRLRNFPEEGNAEEERAYAGLKAEVLLLGYGGGAATFSRTAGVYGINVDETQAKVMVDTFRQGRPLIPAYWRRLENEIRTQVKQGLNPCTLTLPSGRKLWYFDTHLVELEPGRQPQIRTKTSRDKKAFEDVWGGVFTENVVQAAARDVYWDMVLRANARLAPLDAHLILSVYDEVLYDVPQEHAEQATKIVVEEFSRAPTWMPGLPVATKAKLMNFYRKS